ncbi:hypothetical protein G7Y89_g14027 [Cudoniella acicularis]|uniref:Uncharacterized protein n=1 Tax=Cudoniella acicularis TaxID=354080 RepID=A0A8H4VVI0_9HELO|nr:hypothetical protein G7Y89_g14027 [Cudoniella acicularis]
MFLYEEKVRKDIESSACVTRDIGHGNRRTFSAKILLKKRDLEYFRGCASPPCLTAYLTEVMVRLREEATHLVKRPTSNSSVSHRSPSVKPSMRSSRSRITLVGDDAELELKLESIYGTTNDVKEFSWFDHLLAVFCIYRGPKIATTVPERPPEYEDREVHLDSPWVQPVYVLSTERDDQRHLIPKEAKCTIDTGNLQGNIVSRTFLVDVLGYSEANFHKLTKEEEDGGTGITGHKLIPDGAIYLTWYHGNSTRVFRDMRFLISEHPMYDLIIGARSIQKNKILDVPNLMAGEADNLDKLKKKMLDANKEFMDRTVKAEVDEDESAKTKKLLSEMKEERDAAKEVYEDELQHVYENHVKQVKDKKEVERLHQLYEGMTGKKLVIAPGKPHQA